MKTKFFYATFAFFVVAFLFFVFFFGVARAKGHTLSHHSLNAGGEAGAIASAWDKHSNSVTTYHASHHHETA